MALDLTGSFVTLASLKLDVLVEFYTHLLGFPPILYLPNRYAEFQLPGLCLGIFQPSLNQAAEWMAPSSGGMSLCLEVDHLEQAMAAVEAAYVALSIAPGDRPIVGKVMAPSHGREVYAYDLDGNRLILHEKKPSSASVPSE